MLPDGFRSASWGESRHFAKPAQCLRWCRFCSHHVRETAPLERFGLVWYLLEKKEFLKISEACHWGYHEP